MIKVNKCLPVISTFLSTVAIVISTYAISNSDESPGSIISLDLSSEEICINDFAYKVKESGELEKVMVIEPASQINRHSTALRKMVPANCVRR